MIFANSLETNLSLRKEERLHFSIVKTMDLEIEIRYQMLPGSNSQDQEVSPERLNRLTTTEGFLPKLYHGKDGQLVL